MSNWNSTAEKKEIKLNTHIYNEKVVPVIKDLCLEHLLKVNMNCYKCKVEQDDSNEIIITLYYELYWPSQTYSADIKDIIKIMKTALNTSYSFFNKTEEFCNTGFYKKDVKTIIAILDNDFEYLNTLNADYVNSIVGNSLNEFEINQRQLFRDAYYKEKEKAHAEYESKKHLPGNNFMDLFDIYQNKLRELNKTYNYPTFLANTNI